MGIGIVAVAYFLGCLLVLAAIIYLVVKRINDKQNEDFEKRDN
ncbi:MAG: hypothetical protein ACR2MX_11045 [Cyclobacteriaceae bacterium]